MPPMKPKKDEPRQKPDPATVEAVPEKEYETVEATVFGGADALTVDQAKHLLGWEEEPEGAGWTDCFLTDENGKKVRLTKNTKNRSYRPALVEMYIQEHLQRRWRLNGETIIIGWFGEVISGQHRLIALILAEQRRLIDKETNQHWVENWPGPVTMQTVVVTGIDESDEVVNSVDTGAPRSLGDVLYRSHYFAGEKSPAKRRLMAKAADFAIRFLWHRTGAGMDAWAPRRTHAEAIDFLERHQKLIKCLKHVVDENGDTANKLGKHLSLGYSAALMYLMGSGKSDYEKYNLGDRVEKRLDWSLYKRAEEFWALLAGGEDFKEVRYAIGALTNAQTGKKSSVAEVVTVIIKAWRLFAEPDFKGFKEGDERINLGEGDYKTKDDARVLISNPTCGGIDLGEPRDEVVTVRTGGAGELAEPEETPELTEEVEAEKEAIIAENVEGEGGKGVNELVTAARKEWPGRIVAFKHKDHYRVWGKDADAVSKATGMKKDPKLKVDGLQYLRFSEPDFPEMMRPVIKAKSHVVIARVGTDGKPVLVDDDYDPDAKPKGKKGGK